MEILARGHQSRRTEIRSASAVGAQKSALVAADFAVSQQRFGEARMVGAAFRGQAFQPIDPTRLEVLAGIAHHPQHLVVDEADLTLGVTKAHAHEIDLRQPPKDGLAAEQRFSVSASLLQSRIPFLGKPANLLLKGCDAGFSFFRG